MRKLNKKKWLPTWVCLLFLLTSIPVAAETPGLMSGGNGALQQARILAETEGKPDAEERSATENGLEAEGKPETGSGPEAEDKLETENGPEAEDQPETGSGPEADEKLETENGSEPEEKLEAEEEAAAGIESEAETQEEVESGTQAEEPEENGSEQEEADQCVRAKLYHRHTGQVESGGGCHGARREWTTTETVRCNSQLRPSGGSEKGKGVCDSCGGYSSRSSGTCGRVKEKKTKTHVAYDLNCGRTQDTVAAELLLYWNTQEWTKEVVLTAEYVLWDAACKVDDAAFLWNGEKSDQSEITVTENGIYTLQLQLDDNTNAKETILTHEISNIDHTAPTIQDVEWDKEGFVPAAAVTVTAQDWQPETAENIQQVAGCGLHSQAYSFDGGNTWQEENRASLGNGRYDIRVRDRLLNESQRIIMIQNVDDKGPEILQVTKDPSGWTREDVQIRITAEDRQNDLPLLEEGETGYGSGLAEQAFSWDGGRSWSGNDTFCAKDNGTIALWVRDRLGHQTKQTITISNIDRNKPHISVKQEPEQWEEGSVWLTIAAYDEDSGLPERPFSWDGGTSWTYHTKKEFQQEGYYQVLVRDQAGNRNYESILLKKEVPMPAEQPKTVPDDAIPPRNTEPEAAPHEKIKEGEPVVKKESNTVTLPKRKAKKQEQQKRLTQERESMEQEGTTLSRLEQVLLALLVVLLLLLGIGFILWLLCYRVEVYLKGERESFRRVTVGYLIRTGRGYYLELTDRDLKRDDYIQMKLVLTRLFAAGHQGQKLILCVEDVEVVLPIEKEIYC